MGSPPHTWRIQAGRNVFKANRRITSTYVENTISCRQVSFKIEDHLHIRGEYIRNTNEPHHVDGSPPHTWRILAVVPNTKGAYGITSTYVENTWLRVANVHYDRDHLHIRGEYSKQILI